MGFGILLGLIAYFFLVKAIAKAVEKKTGSKRAKYIAIAIFVLIPTWDIIPGWLYFEYLCGTQGGQKIYKTVEVGPEYILKAGEPDRSKSNAPPAVGGEINWAKLRDERYVTPNKLDRDFSKFLHIAKSSTVAQDKENGETLGVATAFWFYGGWLADFLNDHRAQTICPADGHLVHGTILEKVVRPMTPTNVKGN
jgi:hypothetical protein